MDIAISLPPTRSVVRAQPGMMPQAEKKLPARTQDTLTLSPAAREAWTTERSGAVSEEQAEEGTTLRFPSFAEAFQEVTQNYSDEIRAYYAKEHEENLTCDDPAVHIWDKYKNPASPVFRAECSEDERAWAYDQELDLLSGGRHLQMRNPYAFASAGGPPDLDTAALQAVQLCRDKISQLLQDLFAERGLGALDAFSLTVKPDDSIQVTGLEDGELTAEIEELLNQGGYGKDLSQHLKLTTPAGEPLTVEYIKGQLAPVDLQQTLDDSARTEIKKQAGPTWARYSSTYDPNQKAMNETILSLGADSSSITQEQMDRLCAAVRVGAPEIIAEFRARQGQSTLLSGNSGADEQTPS